MAPPSSAPSRAVRGRRLTNRILSSLRGELFRYGVTAVVALAADFSLFRTLWSGFGWDVRPATAGGFALGLTVNYLLSVFWVFRVRTVQNRVWEFAVFATIGLIGLGLTELIMDGLSIRLGVWPDVAKGTAVVLVFGWNFLARKLLLFAIPPALARSRVPTDAAPASTEPYSPVVRTSRP